METIQQALGRRAESVIWWMMWMMLVLMPMLMPDAAVRSEALLE